MKLIGITGCGGYIGSRATGYFLERGYRVRGLDFGLRGHCDALFHYIDNPNFEFMYGDVRKWKDCINFIGGNTKKPDQCDVVINAAAIVGYPLCDKWLKFADDVNVDGMEQITFARDTINHNIPIILTSTGSVYGAVTDGLCTEETPCNTKTRYGLTKLQAEKILLEAGNGIIYRYATAFGTSPQPRVQLLVNEFVYRAYTEKLLSVFQADFKRTFIHIHDFIRSLEFAILNSDKMMGNVYNCGDDSLNWSKRQLAEYVKSKIDCQVIYNDNGKDLDERNYEVSYKKINDLGFKCEVTMESGINELIKAVPLLRLGNRYEPI